MSVPYVGEAHPLDSVVWRALNGRQTQFSEGDDRARRYMADVAPFAGLRDLSPASFASLVPLVPRGDQVAMFTVEPLPPTEQLEILLAKPVHQMIATRVAGPDATTRGRASRRFSRPGNARAGGRVATGPVRGAYP